MHLAAGSEHAGFAEGQRGATGGALRLAVPGNTAGQQKNSVLFGFSIIHWVVGPAGTRSASAAGTRGALHCCAKMDPLGRHSAFLIWYAPQWETFPAPPSRRWKGWRRQGGKIGLCRRPKLWPARFEKGSVSLDHALCRPQGRRVIEAYSATGRVSFPAVRPADAGVQRASRPVSHSGKQKSVKGLYPAADPSGEHAGNRILMGRRRPDRLEIDFPSGRKAASNGRAEKRTERMRVD